MKILFLSRWFPYPPDNGSKLRILALLRGLASQHHVSLLSFSSEPVAANRLPDRLRTCDEVHVVPWHEFRPESWHARFGFLSRTPRSLIDTFSTEMQHKIENMMLQEDFDVVIGSQLNALNYAHYFRGLPAVFEECELGVFHSQYTDTASRSARQRLRAGLTWYKLQGYVARHAKYFRAATVVSENERQLLLQAAPHLPRVEVIPNCLAVEDYANRDVDPSPNNLIFTGSFRYQPNYEAMTWFLRHVYPRVQRGQRNVTLTITGDHANLPLPAATNVVLSGYVDNVQPLISSAWCSIAPLRTGGGTRLKILEAMALGTPVVATSKGAEGLAVEDGVHLLIADTPESFADAVLRILHEPGLRQRLAQNSLELIHTTYSWTNVMPRFLNLLEWVADGTI